MAVLQSLVDCKLLELTTDGVSVREGGEREGGRREGEGVGERDEGGGE